MLGGMGGKTTLVHLVKPPVVLDSFPPAGQLLRAVYSPEWIGDADFSLNPEQSRTWWVCHVEKRGAVPQ